MKSRIEGRNYVILYDGERIPVSINKNSLDDSLNGLIKSVTSLKKVLANAYNKNPEVYCIIDNIFSQANLRIDDGYCWNINYLLELLNGYKYQLENGNDDFKSAKDAVILGDLGYRKVYHTDGLYEKILQDYDEIEVVEEIWVNKPLRRLRTTEWVRDGYVKSSKSIKYQRLVIGKNLLKAINNTKEFN